MVLIGAILAGYVYFTSLCLQRVEHFTPIAAGLALVPSTATVVLTSTFLIRRLLERIGVKRMLIAGLTSMAADNYWLAHISAEASYASAVLPGLLLTSLDLGHALPTASVAITSGVEGRDQGLAGGLFVTGQQTGAAIGLAVLATIAATRTDDAHGSLTAGYRPSFLIATGMALAALATQYSATENKSRCQMTT
ncbi:MAG: MFS transporter [Solirubrobacteraceae bacterium]|jgi:MFS family permease